MFDIGWSELLVIAVVALIVIGPKELPGVLRSVGYWMGKVRRMAAEFQGQFQEAMREAEMADLKKHADDLNEAAQSLTAKFDPMSYVESEAKSAIETPAASSATEPSATEPSAPEPSAPEPSVAAGEAAAPAVAAEPASISVPDLAMPTGIQTMAPPAPELPASEPQHVASAPEPAIPAPEPPAPVAAPASQDRA